MAARAAAIASSSFSGSRPPAWAIVSRPPPPPPATSAAAFTIAPAFTPRRVAGYAESMVGHVEQMAANWTPGERRDLHADMMALTLIIACDTFFRVELKSDVAEIGRAVNAIADEKERTKRKKEIRKEVIKSENLVKGNVDLMNEILTSCAVTDLEGTLVTAEVTGESRSLSRKSCIEFGWAVGLPDLTKTESLFHVKYDARERGEGAGSDTPQLRQTGPALRWQTVCSRRT